MAAKFEYDDEGSTFFYFLLSFQALVIIPCTYYFYPRSPKNSEKRDKTVCNCYNCNVKNNRLRSKEPWRKVKQRLIKFLLLVGWTILLLTLYKVCHLQHDYVAYDPFEILQISPDASTAEIKKAYRRLSLVYHPDKETGDQKMFIQIAKAYSALTDAEARKNWEMYGDPSGPGAMSFGIALPKWIVEKENSIYVLSLYALVFMVALPVAVGVWWYRSLKYGQDQVLLDTTQLYMYFIFKTPYMILKRVIMVISASMEFRKSCNSEIVERPSDNVEVPQLIKELPNLGEKNIEKPLCFGYSIKARAIVHAHLSRIKLSPNLEEDRLYIIKKFPYLIHEFVQSVSQLTMLALAGRISRTPNLQTMENAMTLCPCIVQGMWENKSPLLQLPHINEDLLRGLWKRNVKSVRHLASMKTQDRRVLLRHLNDYQYEDVMNVMGKMPLVDVHVKSEVLDDEDSCTITAGALVTVTATLFRRPMSSLFEDEQQAQGEDSDEEPLEEEPVVEQKSESQKKKNSKSNKKKKAKGGSQLKKKPAKSVPKKTANGSVPPPVEEKKEPHKKKRKEDDNSGAEGGSNSDSSLHPSSDEEGETPGGGDKKQAQDADDAEWDRFQAKVANREKVLEAKSKISHTVHCPYFPEAKEEFWWIYVINKKNHGLVTAPYLVTNLVKQEEVELKFTAPARPGVYTYAVMVKSDSYFDCDVSKTIKLDVKEAKVIDLSQVVWDVSEEEEEKDEEESAVSDSDLATDTGSDED
ncbi:hypothetical protein JTE90_017222 [Oedothorax gibbosus]|uniref:J domain-containing protein n=1 Tax=Oedothorax gibbosus TaxID=931172 RepID=A0AAV6VFR4_9ARAC|nr:hypothetical protein JTE90_017222 [Oedothorax gibbosus]